MVYIIIMVINTSVFAIVILKIIKFLFVLHIFIDLNIVSIVIFPNSKKKSLANVRKKVGQTSPS